jgi:UDP-GlcNAc3NAcA epimerase
MKKIISIIGARPQFIKHAPVQLELQKYYNAITIHSGQHYDENMSKVFFDELNIPRPEYLFTSAGGKPHGEQTGVIMTEIERVCEIEKPDALLIYGDTNSTLAGALVAAKMEIPQIHIEAGLRSYNRSMPEEINRIVADEFAYLLFTPTDSCKENLRKEGIVHERIFLVGDVMCDIMEIIKPRVKRMVDYSYYFATIHRPYNTDDSSRLSDILLAFNSLDRKVIFSIHPRTVSKLRSFGLNTEDYQNIVFVPPSSYVESIGYQLFSEAIITDSGGIQKEAYMLHKKCITLRSETEWVETLRGGWNSILFDNIPSQLPEFIKKQPGEYIENLYGDGTAAQDIISIIRKYI